MGDSVKKKPYSERSDIEKIESNWKKAQGLLDRNEWSSAVVRVATAAEIAANHYIREELQAKRNLEEEFVNNLLMWANGIDGKFRKLIVPLAKLDGTEKQVKALKKKVEEINDVRNLIVHSGQFKKGATAKRVAKEAREVIVGLVNPHKPEFTLSEIDDT